MKNLAAIALATCLLASCQAYEAPVLVGTPTPLPLVTPDACEGCSRTPRGALVLPHVIIQSASLTLVVEDPTRALAQIESAITEIGGVVASSSSWSAPGSAATSYLNARIPPEDLSRLRRLIIGLASQVQSDNVYSEDATAEYRRLQRRLQALMRAEGHLLQLLTHTADEGTAASLVIAQQMVMQEKESIEAQIASYEDRAALATLDVTLNGAAQVLFVE